MVEPKWMQWDPDVTVAAMAYPDSLVLCRVRPTFKAIASLAIPVSCYHIVQVLINASRRLHLCQTPHIKPLFLWTAVVVMLWSYSACLLAL